MTSSSSHCQGIVHGCAESNRKDLHRNSDHVHGRTKPFVLDRDNIIEETSDRCCITQRLMTLAATELREFRVSPTYIDRLANDIATYKTHRVDQGIKMAWQSAYGAHIEVISLGQRHITVNIVVEHKRYYQMIRRGEQDLLKKLNNHRLSIAHITIELVGRDEQSMHDSLS